MSGTVTTQALWQWDTTGPYPVATGYGLGGNYLPTKTGLMPSDLQNFAGVPLQYYQPIPTPVPDAVLIDAIRNAEDYVENETGLLLTPTWVASPPSVQVGQNTDMGLVSSSGSQIQLQGQDYDLPDAAYDFYFPRAQDEGWMVQSLRYKPVRNVTQPSRIISQNDFTGVKNFSYIYPLLDTYFRVPPTWFVEDQDFGLIRLVPSSDVAMLPLFAIQLSVMGWAETLPGALWLQYTAGLTPSDYNTRFRFIKQLVLSIAAIQILGTIQGTVNMGISQHNTLVDGVQYMAKYNDKGPFAGLIENFIRQRDELMHMALTRVAGPSIITL